MNKLVVVTVLAALSLPLAAQQITIKPSPANDSLVSAAKDSIENTKKLNDALQQAKSGLDMSQKSLSDAYAAKSKELTEELKNDKKYAGKLKELDTISKQLSDSTSQAQEKFKAYAQPLQQKVAVDNALVDGLVPVVRKENNLPDSATFDPATQTWSEPKASTPAAAK